MRAAGIWTGAVVAAVAAFAPLAAAAFVLPVPADVPVELQQNPQPWLDAIDWRDSQVLDGVGYPIIGIADSGLAVGSTDFGEGSLDLTSSADCLLGNGVLRPATSAADVDDPTLGHGTAVASLAAAPINGFGIVGVSPTSPLAIARFTQGERDLAFAPCAIRWLARVARGRPLVANLSFGATPASSFAHSIRRAMRSLVASTAVIVAAVGNVEAERSGIDVPARDPHTIAVGDSGGAVGVPGPQIDLVAPGSELRVPVAGSPNEYESRNGTSFAAPLVAGAAALVWGANPGIDDPQVIGYLLRRGAEYPVGTGGPGSGGGRWHGPAVGFGELSIAGALAVTPVPRVAEHEPNDWAGSASRVTCPAKGRCILRGIIVRTDDLRDFWSVARGACPPKGRLDAWAAHQRVRATCAARGARVLVVVSLARGADLVAYRLRLR